MFSSNLRTVAIQNDYYGVEVAIAEAFAVSLDRHIMYVQEAARMLQVPKEQIKTHDQSKWSEDEFPGYAYYFHGHFRGGSAHVDEFAKAWLHHIHYNPHHWQHWIFPDGYSPDGSSVENGIVEMPKNFVLEMVADWMGASKTYTGIWDMKDWLQMNIPKIKVHSETAKYLREVLDDLGYADIVNAKEFEKGFEYFPCLTSLIDS